MTDYNKTNVLLVHSGLCGNNKHIEYVEYLLSTVIDLFYISAGYTMYSKLYKWRK